eukprot:9210854-Karenia_brevis.AAC.1
MSQNRGFIAPPCFLLPAALQPSSLLVSSLSFLLLPPCTLAFLLLTLADRLPRLWTSGPVANRWTDGPGKPLAQ